MLENIRNSKIDELCDELNHLKARNQFLEHSNKRLKQSVREITVERNRINDKLIAANFELAEMKRAYYASLPAEQLNLKDSDCDLCIDCVKCWTGFGKLEDPFTMASESKKESRLVAILGEYLEDY